MVNNHEERRKVGETPLYLELDHPVYCVWQYIMSSPTGSEASNLDPLFSKRYHSHLNSFAGRFRQSVVYGCGRPCPSKSHGAEGGTYCTLRAGGSDLLKSSPVIRMNKCFYRLLTVSCITASLFWKSSIRYMMRVVNE